MTFAYRMLLVCTLLFTLQNSMAQEAIKNTVKQEAEKMAKATLNGDYDLLLDYTHPNVIKFSGGKKKLGDLIAKGIETMAEDGATIDVIEIGEPTALKMHRGDYQALVPKTTTMTMNGRKIISKDYLFGFSDGIGEKWTFVEADKMKSEAAKQLFPGFTTDIIIPEKEAPIVNKIDEESIYDVPEFDENEGTYDNTDELATKITGFIGLAIGAACLIFVVMLVIFIVVYLKKRKKKEEVITTKVQTTASKKIETIICKDCEGKNRSDSKYCSSCGYSLGS